MKSEEVETTASSGQKTVADMHQPKAKQAQLGVSAGFVVVRVVAVVLKFRLA